MKETQFVITPHRAKILSVLLGGDIEDVSGQATPKLREHTGHRHTNSLSGVLSQMEQAGLVERDVNGRRTYRIALTRQGRRLAEQLADEGAAERIEHLRAGAPTRIEPAQAMLDGAVDIDLLAGVLLKKALLATQAQEESAGAKDALAKLAKAEAKAADLEAELKAARSDAAELRALVKTLEHNNTVLASQMDKVKKNPGTPIKDLISRAEQRELETLMRQLPSARG